MRNPGPNRKLLKIDLVSDPNCRDCVEDIVVSVLSWWGRRHEMMFAASWSFDLKPGVNQLLGPRLSADIRCDWNLLEAHHGLRVAHDKYPVGIDLIHLVLRELGDGRPVAISRTIHPGADLAATPAVILVVGFDHSQRKLLYRAGTVFSEDPQEEVDVKTLQYGDIAEWSGPHLTFSAVEAFNPGLDWRALLAHAATRFGEIDDPQSRSGMICSFAGEVGEQLDIQAEVRGYPNWFWVPLFYNLRRISQGRKQFSSLLTYLGTLFRSEAMSMSVDFENTAQSWQLARSLLIKYSLNADPGLLDRVSSRILELAHAEQELAMKLLALVDRGLVVSKGRSTVPDPSPLPPKRADPWPAADLAVPFVAPRSQIERELASIWEHVLGVERVGIHDNFFDLGGDSLLGMKILAQIHRTGLSLGAGQIYRYQTVAELAAVVGTCSNDEIEPAPATGSMPFLPLQYKGISEAGPGYSREGVVKFLFPLEVDLTSAQLNAIATLLMRHHDALRLRFPRDYKYRDPRFCDLLSDGRSARWLDLSHLDRKKIPTVLEAATDRGQSHIDLEAGPLFVLVYLKMPAELANTLCVCIHHMVSDAISNQILEEDIRELATQAAAGRRLQLPRRTTSIKQWSRLLDAYARSAARAEIDYWKALPWTGVRPIPPDCPDKSAMNADRYTVVAIKPHVRMTRVLFSTCRRCRTSIHELLLAVLAGTLSKWSDSNVVLIEDILHGRDPIFDGTDLSRTVGFFSVEVPLVLELNGLCDPANLLQEVASQIRGIPAKGIGYSLLRYLSREREVVRFLESIPRYQARYNAVIEPSFPGVDEGGETKSGGLEVEWHESPAAPAAGSKECKTMFTLENKPRMEEGRLVIPLRFGRKGLFERKTMEGVVDCYSEFLQAFAELGQAQSLRREEYQ